MRQIVIRPASPQDITFMAKAACANNYSAPWGKKEFSDELSQPAARLYTAFYGVDFAGFISLRFCCGEGEINNFAVMPQFMRLGIGSALLAYAVRQAGEENISKLVLEVNSNNSAAVNLYKKFSFKTVNIRKKFYNNKEDAFLMVKDL